MHYLPHRDPGKRFTYKFSLTRQLYERGLARDDVLNLYKFIDWVMTLPEPLEIRYNEAIYQLEEQRAMSYVTSAERIGMKKGFEQGLLQGIEQGLEQGIEQGREQGIEQGIERGVEQGKREGEYALVLRLLQRKFGPLPKAYRQRLAQADADTLLLWGERVLDATSLENVFGTGE